MVKTVKTPTFTTIVLRPNRSASWRQTKIFILSMAILILTVALAWTAVGAWFVLPFAGLEVGLVGFLMYRVCYKSYQQQVITIDPESILIEQGVHRPVLRCKLNKRHTHLSVQEAENEFDTTQLSLQDDNQSIEVGRFLNHQDAILAKSSFQEAGLQVCSDKWWKY